MADIKAEGAELKKMVKLAKTQSLAFAFCPGPRDASDVLIIHKNKKPEMLAKIARNESDGTKVAFGTFEIKGKTMTVTCIRELPAIDKQLKKYMKNQKMPMNVRVLDARGNTQQSDAEDLSEEEPEKDNTNEATNTATAATYSAPSNTKVPSSPTGQDPERAALVSRITDNRSKIEYLDGELRPKLKKVLSAAAQFLKAGNLSKATEAIDAVENAIAQTMDN